MSTVPEFDDAAEFNMPAEPIYEVSALGGGLKLRNRRTVELTVQLASHVLELAEFEGERPFYESHAIFLARQMEANLFLWEQISIISCFYNGREYRMNARHTCWGRTHANLPDGARTPVQWLRYDAAEESDMRQLYASIDRGKPRTKGNVVLSYLLGRPEFVDFPGKVLRQLATSLSMWLWETLDQRKLHTGDECSYLLLTDYHKPAVYVGNFMRNCPVKSAKHLWRSPVVAAMFASFAKAPQIAKEFWTVVHDGIGVNDKQDPRYVLRHFLMTSSLSSIAGGDLKGVSEESMYRGCIQAWNIHRAGKTMRAIQPGKFESRPEAR